MTSQETTFNIYIKYTPDMEELLDGEPGFVARGYQFEPVLNANLEQSDCSSSEDNDVDIELPSEPLPNNTNW